MDDEVVIGLDPHKASNTIAVMDRTERVIARGRFRNDDAGIAELLDSVAEHESRVWAVEGANGIGRQVAQRLVAMGEVVVDVPAKLATQYVSIRPGTAPRPTTPTRSRSPALRSTAGSCDGCSLMGRRWR